MRSWRAFLIEGHDDEEADTTNAPREREGYCQVGGRRWRAGHPSVLIAQKLPRGGAVWRDTHAAYVATVTRRVALHV
jgi:hypothetical protein